MEDVLYVWKKDNEQFMVSKLPLGDIYVKYTKIGDGCWIPEDEGDTEVETSYNEVSEEVSDNKKVSEKVNEVVNKGTASKKIKTSNESDITTTKCDSNYNPSKDLNAIIAKLNTIATAVANNTIYLLSHIDIRFTHLACLLEQNDNLSVVIAGDDNDTDIIPTSHSLGKGFATGQWKLTGDDKNIIDFCYSVVQQLITIWCKKLMKKYNTDSLQRVSYGEVGIKKGMSNEIINVWGANLGNYNKSNIGGEGQADDVKDPNSDEGNAAGAFGIITTPLNIAYWNTISGKMFVKGQFRNDELIKASFATTHAIGGNKSKSKTKKRRN